MEEWNHDNSRLSCHSINESLSSPPNINLLNSYISSNGDSHSSTYGYNIVTLSQWLIGYHIQPNSDLPLPLPLIDLRPHDQFQKRHLSLAHNLNKVPIINLAISTLINGERSCELPARHVEFSILMPLDHSQEDLHRLFFSKQSRTTGKSRRPWLVRQVMLDDEQLWLEADALNMVKYSMEMVPMGMMPRLWEPDQLMMEISPLLKEWVAEFSARPSLTSQEQDDYQSEASMGIVVDLGSGAGRDICFLAEECMQFFLQLSLPRPGTLPLRFIGMDNHKGSSRRCVPLWKHRGVERVTECRNINLTKLYCVGGVLTSLIHHGSGKMFLFAVRYLNRKLVSYIAQSSSSSSLDPSQTQVSPPLIYLPIGTVFATSHFCKTDPGMSWNFDHPKESQVWERHELRELFESVVVTVENAAGRMENVNAWRILKDYLCWDGDHGRPMIQFVVLKVA